jgi:hypothetical protein
MGKKDYQLFADAVSLIKDKNDKATIMTFLMKIFYTDNPRFDQDRFYDWIDRRVKGASMKGTHYNPKYMPLGVK